MRPRRLLPATERIAYQHSSRLAQRLTDACQAVFDFVRRTEVTDAAGTPQWRENRVKQVANYMRKDGFVDSITKTIKDELNLRVEKVNVHDDRIVNAYMWPIVKGYNGTDKEWDMVAGMNRAAGGYEPESPDALLTTISENVDHNTGVLGPKASEVYGCGLGFYAFIFVAHEFYSNVRFTAAEVAAITIHELGHAVTMAEEMGYTHHQTKIVADSIKYLDEKNKIGDPVAEAAKLKKRVAALPDGETKQKAAALLTQIEQSKDSEAQRYGILVVISILATLMVTMTLVTNASLGTLLNLRGAKTSDLRVTNKNQAHIERIADEFAARHGVTAALASGLIKLHTAYEIGERRSALGSVPVVGAALTTLAMGLAMISSALSVSFTAVSGDYDLIFDRLDHMARNNMAALKDPNMPAAERDAMLDNTERALKTIEAYKSRGYVKAREFIWGTLFRVTKPGTLLGAIVDGNLAADYEKLQGMTTDLIRNRFFYHAAQLARARDAR